MGQRLLPERMMTVDECWWLIVTISAECSVTVGGGSVVRQDFKGGSPLWVERQVEPWKCSVSAVGKQTQEVKQQLEDTQAVLAAAQKQPARAPAPATSEQIAQAAGAAFSTAFAAALMQTAQR